MERRSFIKSLIGLVTLPALPDIPIPEEPRFEVEVFQEPEKPQRAGFYAWQETGFAVLDNRRVILGEF